MRQLREEINFAGKQVSDVLFCFTKPKMILFHRAAV